jgi:hypothetical protein
MGFITNEEAKKSLISEIKSKAAITSLLGSTDEVREVQWQGDTFVYPNLRLRIIDNIPFGNTGCFHKINFGIQVHSEEASSREAEHISGIIADNLNETSFNQDGVTWTLRITNIVPALRTDKLTWQSETLFLGIAS